MSSERQCCQHRQIHGIERGSDLIVTRTGRYAGEISTSPVGKVSAADGTK